MKIALGPRIQRLLGITDSELETEFQDVDPVLIKELQLRVQQALAATCLDDMRSPQKLSVSDIKIKRYHVELRFKWSWPVPVSLQLSVIDETKWEIELVRDGDEDL